MQFKQTAVRLLFLLLPFSAFSQTTYFPQGARENILLERLQIKAKTDSVLNFSKTKPLDKRQFTPLILRYYTASGSRNTVDDYNAQIALMNGMEWLDTSVHFKSKKPLGKNFYQVPTTLYQVNDKDFFLAVNPVFQYYLGKESNNSEHIFLNTRGVTLRGRIANRIGFAAYVTDNQERDPLYVQQMVTLRHAVPGEGFYKSFKTTGYDYFDARGYVTFSATKYINFQFGYDKNFIGDGYRSLFLCDVSAPYLFFKINTRIWRFNYQNLFMELNTANRLNADRLIPKKYAAIHHLDLAVTKWMNIGLFEGIIFGRTNHFEFGYLNPVIFYRSAEQQYGSFDNAVAGLDAKANLAHTIQLYGQFLIDEFNFTELRNGSGWWANKIGYQLGAKYIDAFNIPNLDLQIETNRVRPFTYSHFDSVANYTHYNQPLAHPLGANFQELIGIARYQPAPKWFMELKGIYYMQGRDTGNTSFGSNIFLPNQAPYRTKDFGFNVGDPIHGKTALASLLVSYQWKPNFFIEVNMVARKDAATIVSPAQNTFVIYGGVRWNMHRRDFDF